MYARPCARSLDPRDSLKLSDNRTPEKKKVTTHGRPHQNGVGTGTQGEVSEMLSELNGIHVVSIRLSRREGELDVIQTLKCFHHVHANASRPNPMFSIHIRTPSRGQTTATLCAKAQS